MRCSCSPFLSDGLHHRVTPGTTSPLQNELMEKLNFAFNFILLNNHTPLLQCYHFRLRCLDCKNGWNFQTSEKLLAVNHSKPARVLNPPVTNVISYDIVQIVRRNLRHSVFFILELARKRRPDTEIKSNLGPIGYKAGEVFAAHTKTVRGKGFKWTFPTVII